MSQSVDSKNYSSECMLGGDNIVVLVGPPGDPSDSTPPMTVPQPGSDDSGASNFRLVGVIQTLSVQTGSPKSQINEIGSNAKYLASSRGQKQMTISHIMTTIGGSVLYALYRYMVETGGESLARPAGKLWLTLSHPIFKRPFGMLFMVGSYDGDGTFTASDYIYHTDVVIQNVASQMVENDVGIANNVSLTWSKTLRLNSSYRDNTSV